MAYIRIGVVFLRTYRRNHRAILFYAGIYFCILALVDLLVTLGLWIPKSTLLIRAYVVQAVATLWLIFYLPRLLELPISKVDKELDKTDKRLEQTEEKIRRLNQLQQMFRRKDGDDHFQNI